MQLIKKHPGFAQTTSERAAGRRVPRKDEQYLHHDLTVTITDETSGARSSVQLEFFNRGDHAITVTDVAPFAGITRVATLNLGGRRSAHLWPRSIAVESDELPLVIPPGACRGYSIAVLYDMQDPVEAVGLPAASADRAMVDYFLRIESEVSRGELRMTSFKYLTREVVFRGHTADLGPSLTAGRYA